MTIAERAAYERRIAELEVALAEYMRVMDMTDFTVGGDLRHDFLESYGRCLAVLPGYKRPAPLGGSACRSRGGLSSDGT